MITNMINITPLLPGREAEIAADLKDMHAKGMISSAAFSFTLVPEGNPATDKAERLAELFRKQVEALKGSGIPVGILLQATMGHGWIPDEPASFQRFTFADGTTPYIFCPLDKDFLAYIRTAMRKLGALNADFFMLDDDTRMLTGREGCYCPSHLAEFNRRNGTNFTERELKSAITSDEKLARVWDEFQQEGLLELARVIRKAFDETNPKIPAMFCACAGDIRHAPAMARILAAPGQSPIVRINNACYMQESLRSLPQWMYKTNLQIAALPEDFTVLAETDTCPHNRYSTSAAMLHMQYAWSLLNGCKGGKLWVTQLHDFEPESGVAYRKKLYEYAGFYGEIAAMKPEWSGFADPIPKSPPFNAIKYPHGVTLLNWGGNVFGLMGLPFSFTRSPEKNRQIALSGPEIEFFSDAELQSFLSGQLLLDGSAAIELTKRGYAGKIGVSASEWNLPKATFECTTSGKLLRKTISPVHLKLESMQTEVRSRLFHAAFAFAEKGEELAPGSVRFQNDLGGTVFTLAGKLVPFGFPAFGMLDSLRKQWLCEELGIGLRYSEDAPLCMHAFRDRGILTICVINLGFDPLNDLPLAGVPQEIGRAEMLHPDGTWQTVQFAERKILRTTILPLQIAFFRLH